MGEGLRVMLRRVRPTFGRNILGLCTVGDNPTLCWFFPFEDELKIKVNGKDRYVPVALKQIINRHFLPNVFLPVRIVKRGKRPSLDKRPIWLDKYRSISEWIQRVNHANG